MEFNGIKFFNGEGYKLPDEMEDEIEALIKNNMKDVVLPIGSGVGKIDYRFDLRDEYVKFMEKCVPVDLKGMKIVVDCAEARIPLYICQNTDRSWSRSCRNPY